jgi:hypothetical protein
LWRCRIVGEGQTYSVTKKGLGFKSVGEHLLHQKAITESKASRKMKPVNPQHEAKRKNNTVPSSTLLLQLPPTLWTSPASNNSIATGSKIERQPKTYSLNFLLKFPFDELFLFSGVAQSRARFDELGL